MQVVYRMLDCLFLMLPLCKELLFDLFQDFGISVETRAGCGGRGSVEGVGRCDGGHDK